MVDDLESVLPPHGGYRNLKSFQLARLVYDVTIRFCDRYISKKSRTHDQMVQAARSGPQNIAEGSMASGTSKKTEITLTKVARSSLEELLLDYEDFLRHRNLVLWDDDDPRRRELVDRRCKTVKEVALWVKKISKREFDRYGRDGRYGQNGQSIITHPSIKSMASIKSIYPLYAQNSANAALVLTEVTHTLLDRQINTQANDFKNHGGFSERLYRIRMKRRGQKGDNQ